MKQKLKYIMILTVFMGVHIYAACTKQEVIKLIDRGFSKIEIQSICGMSAKGSKIKTWDKTIGGKASDAAKAVAQTKDGGYIFAGSTESFGGGSYDGWVVKLNINGNIEWHKTFGGKDSDSVNSIYQTRDGGYILAGYTFSFSRGGTDAWIIRLDSNGNIIWDKTFGGKRFDQANSVIQTKDGGYIFAGYTESFGLGSYDGWVVKLDSNGNKLWDKTFGGEGSDQINSVVQTKDGGYVIAGWRSLPFSAKGADAWVIKLDRNGKKVWDKTFDNSHSSDGANSIVQAKDGGYVFAGETRPDRGKVGAWIVKLNSRGNKLWDKAFHGMIAAYEAKSIANTSDSGYIVAGYVNSLNNMIDKESEVWVIKLDRVGNKVWSKSFGGNASDLANSVVQAKDGGYIIAGITESFGVEKEDAWIIKLDSNGN